MATSKRVGVIHAYPSPWLVDALSEDGWQVVLIGDLEAARFAGRAEVLRVRLWDEHEVMRKVSDYHRERPFDVLLPVYEGATVLTAAISATLGLPCYDEAAALASRNKFLAYRRWREQDVPVPHTVALTEPEHSWPMLEQVFGGDAVIKLADSMNSQGVIRVRDQAGYDQAIALLQNMLAESPDIDQQDDRNRFAYGRGAVTLIAQEFCGGDEVGIDVVLDGERGHVLGVFQKARAEGPCFAESLSIWPTSLGSETERELGALALRAVRALGVQLGAAHVEIRIGKDGPKVLEVGLRPGGAYTVKAAAMLTGINQYTWLAAALTGRALPLPRAPEGAILYGGVVYPHSGMLRAVHGTEVFERTEGLVDVQILNEPGQRVHALPRSAQPHFCYYLLSAASREAALEAHRAIQASVRIEVDPLPAATRPVDSGDVELADALGDAVRRIQRWRAEAGDTAALAWQPELLEQLRGVGRLPQTGQPLAQIIDDAFARLEQGYCNVAHPLYLGYISPKPLLESVVGDFIASALNQTPGAWRAGPAATQIELETLHWLREFLTLPKPPAGQVGGLFTGGGSMANLTALKLARDAAFEGSSGAGLSAAARPAVYMSREGHFSIIKAADMLGFGRDAVRLIDTDGAGCIRLDALRMALEADLAAGWRPVCIIGVAGTSASGAVDPLVALAHMAADYRCWFHIDGAAGIAMAALPEQRARFDGMQLADSIAFDPCKWMFTAFGLGCLLLKDSSGLRESFDVIGHYWEDLEELEFFRLGFYGTRQWRSLGLWMAMRTLGADGYRTLLAGLCGHAASLREALLAQGGFEVLPTSGLPVCCFRPLAGAGGASEQAYALQRRINDSGRAFLTLMDWQGETYIRAAFNNYSTTQDDVARLAAMLADGAMAHGGAG